MSRKFNCFGLLIVLVAVVALCPAVANATIVVTNEWKMGEADPGAAYRRGANPTVDSVGAWNMTKNGTPTYVNGAYTGSSLALTFSGGDPPTQYYNSFNNTSGTYISSTSNSNWGFDFWFNASSLPASGAEANLVAFGGHGGWFGSETAVEFELFGNAGGRVVVSDWAGSGFTADYIPPTNNTWTHVVYADENGTAHMFINGTEYSLRLRPVHGSGSTQR